jgi:hypothetical protein
MNKYLLITLLSIFSLTISSHGQIIKKVIGKPIDLKPTIDWSGWKQDWSIDKLKKEVTKLHDIKFLNYPTENFDTYKDKFHPIDFNLDGQCDIIFYGNPGGAESNYVICCMSEGDNYILKLLAAGNIIELSDYKSKSGLSLTIHNYACCMGQYDHIYKFEPSQTNNSFDYKKSYDIAFFVETTSPTEYFKDKIHFTVENETYTLRAEPLIDNETTKFIDVVNGNILATYTKGATGYAIAEKIDDTGRIWWYVIMDNKLPPKNTSFYAGFDDSNNYQSSGWMSSRYLTRNE